MPQTLTLKLAVPLVGAIWSRGGAVMAGRPAGRFARARPAVVEELVPRLLPVGGVQQVLRALLREGVSIRDLVTILETLADHAGRTQDADALTALVRQALARPDASARSKSSRRANPRVSG